MLDKLGKNAQRCWIPGKWVSIDEQTIAFKGQHGLALRITYKREGGGYQCDAVCEDGYTFSFYFRRGDAPELPEMKELDLSPTARQVIWLMMQLPDKWTRVYITWIICSTQKSYSLLPIEILHSAMVLLGLMGAE